jgi:Fe-S cluster assembly protein SufD
MQSKEDKIKEDLLSVFKNAHPVLSRNGLKEKALDYYKHNNFPGLRDEGWRQTNLTSLFKTAYQETHETVENINVEKFLIPNLDADILVFINGFFSKALSRTKNDAIIITDIKLATEAYPEIFGRYFESTNILSENNFTALNTAFAHHGSFIHIAKNQTSGKPVHILNINTAKTPVLTQIRNLVLVEKSAEIKIVETFHSVNKTVSFSNIVTELILEENAKADWVRLQMETNEANQINHMRVLQNSNSYFKSNCFTFSGKLIRNNISVNLMGEGSNCNLWFIFSEKHTTV